MPRPLNQTETDLNADNLLRLPAEFGCPVWVYDAQIVREKIAALHQFDVVRFAQKACSNIHILRMMLEQGVKVDSVSLGEIERALAAGFDPKADSDAIVFTADLIDDATLARVHELQIPVNAGSVDMLEQLGQVSPRHRVWLRINPGFGHGHSQKTNTGAKTASTGSGMPICLRRWRFYNATTSSWWAFTCISGPAWITAILSRFVARWCVRLSILVRIWRRSPPGRAFDPLPRRGGGDRHGSLLRPVERRA